MVRYGKSLDDDRLFPFTYTTAREMWNNTITKAEFTAKDNTTNRYKVHIHVLRKFFRTNMATKIPRDLVEALMGHEGYLTEVYRKYSAKQLAEFYTKAENTVTVFRDQNGVKRLRKEIGTKMEGYDELIARQATKITQLEAKVAEYEQSKELELADALIAALQGPKAEEIAVAIEQLSRR